MGTTLTGNPANITSPLSVNIASIADNGSGACRCTAATTHFFGNGDTVLVTGTGTALDGLRWVIAVISATVFDLVGSTYTATATGVARDLSFTPQVRVPSDGDPASAQLSGLISCQQALLDRTQYGKLVFQMAAPIVGAIGVSGIDWFAYTAYQPLSAGKDVPVLGLTGLEAGDIVEVIAAITMSTGNGIGNGYVRVEYEEGHSGNAFAIAGSEASIAQPTTSFSRGNASMIGTMVYGAGYANGALNMYLNGKVDSSGGGTFTTYEGNMIAKVWRT